MALLQRKLSMKVAQRQILTPGLMQMVSVLALNKLELKEMINTEIIENPVLEEIEDNAASYEELAGQEGDRERSAEDAAHEKEKEKDPFDEIDFGSYFQDYLDPGYRTGSNFEELDKPSFEHFLSKPSTLSDHLHWQLGALALAEALRVAAELVIGNLNEDGYLTASDEELAASLLGEFAGGDMPMTADEATELITEARKVVTQLDPIGIGARDLRECLVLQIEAQRREHVLLLKRRSAA